MVVQFCCSLLPSLVAIALSPASPAQESLPKRDPGLTRENLLVYRDGDGSLREVQTQEDWQHRRAHTLASMQAIMGELPDDDSRRCALDIEIEEEIDCGEYVRRLITYASEPGSRTPAYLLVPKRCLRGKARAPGILCLHPTHHKLGYKIVVGLGGEAGRNREYAKELAERGFVTLAPSYPLLADYQPDIVKLGYESGTMKAIWDNIRGVDLLLSLPYVEGEAVGAIGHSLGGHNAVYTAAFDKRIEVIVSSCGLDAYTDYYGGDEDRWQPERGWCQLRYIPHLAGYRGRLDEIPFDFHEMLGALAPRHVFISAPLEDGNFQWRSVDRVAAAARPVYRLHGAPGRLRIEHPIAATTFPGRCGRSPTGCSAIS